MIRSAVLGSSGVKKEIIIITRKIFLNVAKQLRKCLFEKARENNSLYLPTLH